MTTTIAIYIYIMGWLFAVIVLTSDSTFCNFGRWWQALILALWPLIIPAACLQETIKWLVHKRRLL